MSMRFHMRLASMVTLVACWWIASRFTPPEVLPSPFLIARTMLRILTEAGPEGNSAFFHIGITFLRIAIAFVAAMLAGIAVGLAMGLRKTVEHSLMSLIPLFLTIPTILMVFLAVLWFGFSEVGSLVAVMAVVTLPPVPKLASRVPALSSARGSAVSQTLQVPRLWVLVPSLARTRKT